MGMGCQMTIFPPADLANPGIEPMSLASPVQADSLPLLPPGKPPL